MRPIVVFGAGDIAELADFYFAREAGREVVAFVVDAAYRDGDERFGRPLVALEEVAARFPPDRHDAFVALSYQSMNRLRAAKCAALKALGYRLASYISPRATVYTDRIGENAFILEDNTIQPFVTIGDNVTLWSGNHIGHHSSIGDNSFITSHVVVSGGVRVGANCFVGVNATIRDHVTLGDFTLVGAGGLIIKDTAPESVHMVADHTQERRVKSTRLKSI
ncbi:acetyltransferase [Azospirillum canadense]|uniref:acetyltransferase n=1 Tax=Azospirillum canadense TaxID=403962 RepID=UPI002225FB7D|nr:acetyltransferase [Azospirillum canadense]MCW2240842.1 sugar O-acyltransferase (sialic acid O-acetyltransferase NeuD family) [Azospirillum canadense]